MTDDFFINEFVDYRMAEIEEATTILRKFAAGQVSPDYINGAMFMLRTIINLPVKLAKTKEEQERAESLKAQMMGQFEAKMMRKFMQSDMEAVNEIA